MKKIFRILHYFFQHNWKKVRFGVRVCTRCGKTEVLVYRVDGSEYWKERK